MRITVGLGESASRFPHDQAGPLELNSPEVTDIMTNWQKRFAKKLETVRTATRDRFEEMADDTLESIYKEFAEFTTRLHVRATAPLSNPGIRTFKFTMTENSYLLMTFRHAGLQCESQSEFFVPGHTKFPPTTEVVELCDFNHDWCQNMFEQSLDRFLDMFTDSMGEMVGDLADANVN